MDFLAGALLVVGIFFQLSPHLKGDTVDVNSHVDLGSLFLGIIGVVGFSNGFVQIRVFNSMQKGGVHYLIVIVYSLFLTTIMVPAVMYPSMA